MMSANGDGRAPVRRGRRGWRRKRSGSWRRVIVPAHRMNYARRQQYRRLSRAAAGAAAGGVAILLATALVGVGVPSLGGFVLLEALGLGLYSRHWLSLARRSAVGARSEDAVQRVLAPLQAEGWRLRHSLPWQGRGDIDSVAIAPPVAIAIEIKTRTYDARHLARVREQVAWLSRRRRRWARNGALGVVCIVRARGVEQVEHAVLVVSIDRLTHVRRVAAGMGPDARSADCAGCGAAAPTRRRPEDARGRIRFVRRRDRSVGS